MSGWKWVLGVVVAFALAIGGAAYYRIPLAEQALQAELSALGFPDAQFEITELGAQRAVVETLSLGPDLPSADRIAVAYEPIDVAGGQIAAVEVGGVRGDYAGVREVLRRMTDAWETQEPGGGGAPPDALTLDDVVVSLAGSPLGEGDVTINGRFDRREAALAADLTATLTSPSGTGALELRSDDALAEGGAAFSANGDVSLALAPFSEALGAEIVDGRAAARFEASAQLPPEFEDTPFLGLVGEANVAVSLNDLVAPDVVAAADAALALDVTLSDRRVAVVLAEPGEVTAQGVVWPAALDGRHGPPPTELEASLLNMEDGAPVVEAAWSVNGVVVESAIDLHAKAFGADAAEPPLARIAATLASGGPQLSMLGDDLEMTFDLSAAGLSLGAARIDAGRWTAEGGWRGGELTLEGPIEVAGAVSSEGVITARGAALSGDMSLVAGEEGWSLTAASGAALRADSLDLAGQLAAPSAAAVSFEMLAIQQDASEIAVQAQTIAEPARWTLFPDTVNRKPLARVSGRIDADIVAPFDGPPAGTIAVADGAFDMLDWGLRVTGLTITAPVDAVIPPAQGATEDEARRSATALATIADLSNAPRFTPVSAIVDATRDAAFWRLKGDVSLAAGAASFPLRGRYALDGSNTRLRLGPRDLSFERGGLQPAALSPMLEMVTRATGVVTAEADLIINQRGTLGGALSVATERLDIESTVANVERLQGDVVFGRLAPFGTLEPQEITARRVVAGAPLDSPRFQFSLLERGGAPVLRIERAEAALADGAILVDKQPIVFDGGDIPINIGIQSISVEKLIEEWQISGLKGTGLLTGEIPLRLTETGPVIQNGVLAAEGPGRMQVQWGDARDALAAQGQSVELLVQALEDFRYDALSIDVQRPLNGELTLGVGMSGSNPEVLEGYPFQFNINLDGELEKILAAVREGRELGSNLVKSGIGG